MKKPTLEELRQIVEFFPIGKKMRYSPEYKQEVILDTLIVAYCVDGEFIYSWDSIEFDDEGVPTAFLVGPQSQRVEAARVSEFQLLVPDTSSLENTLDYPRRAMIGRGRQFYKGNVIALISNAGNRGISTLETEVDKRFVLKDGPYAQSAMVLLTPQIDTLTTTDQRGISRARINVPVTMTIQERLRGPGIIVDISDVALRVRAREGHAMPPMSRGDDVTLDIELDEQTSFRIKCAVMRRTAEACVIKMVSRYLDRRFVPLGPLDLLELKSALLNFGK
ncbi:MAG: hypothetical protein KJ634_14125 [Gammaproteobacteria bacterium]|nr:hypothetical protein [Gammaproteobacteria bacterium]MBU1416750.1 hypothetical protein [Gammaproteobacteria bacterium]